MSDVDTVMILTIFLKTPMSLEHASTSCLCHQENMLTAIITNLWLLLPDRTNHVTFLGKKQ